MKSKIHGIEAVIFLVFGFFQMHRVWALVRPEGYANFWLSAIENRSRMHWLPTGILALLFLAGTVILLRHPRERAWWRFLYPLGLVALVTDLIGTLTARAPWLGLMRDLYNPAAPYFTAVWGFAILLGFVCLMISQRVLKRRLEYRIRAGEIDIE